MTDHEGDNQPAGRESAIRKLDAAWRAERDTAPLPLLRWGAVLAIAVGVAIARWAAGVPHDITSAWPALAVALVLILPDLGSITFGGLKLEMRQTKAEVERLGSQIQIMQVQQAAARASIVLNDPEAMAAMLATTMTTISERFGTIFGDELSSALTQFIKPPETEINP